jgi:hypothetical protein
VAAAAQARPAFPGDECRGAALTSRRWQLVVPLHSGQVRAPASLSRRDYAHSGRARRACRRLLAARPACIVSFNINIMRANWPDKTRLRPVSRAQRLLNNDDEDDHGDDSGGSRATPFCNCCRLTRRSLCWRRSLCPPRRCFNWFNKLAPALLAGDNARR